MSYDKNERGYIPPFKTGKQILIRGTEEWDERERARREIGCRCLSFGPVPPPGRPNRFN